MKNVLFLSALLFLSSCVTGSVAKEVIPSEPGSIQVFFCPETNCSSELAKLTEGGGASCAFYDIDLPGLNVGRAIVEKSNNVKGDVINDSNFGLMHNKFCSINHSIVWTGSFNPTYNDNYRNNNNVVVIHSRILAENYFEEYEEMRNDIFGAGAVVRSPKVYVGGALVEAYFCPEDDCRGRIIEALAGAQKSIYFMAFTFTDQEIAGVLVGKSRSIEVEGLVEKRSAFAAYSVFPEMNRSFPVAVDSNKYTMHHNISSSTHYCPKLGVLHHKVFIIDGETVITGSMNPTKSANERNDENILIIHDRNIASKYLEEFDCIWDRNQG